VGESPVWDAATDSLWLIDIVGPTVLRVCASGAVDRWKAPDQVGAVAPLGDGRVAVAVAQGFCILDPRTSQFTPVSPAHCAPGAVLSEGGVDPQGRFVATSGDSRFQRPIGAVGLGRRRVFFSSAREAGFPDGSAVDAEDHLWVVLHQSRSVVRLDPDGRIVDRLELPIASATSIAFGGTDLDELYVTSVDPTKIPGVEPGTVDRENDGHLFRITGSGFVGAPTTAVRAVPGAAASTVTSLPEGVS
jgi:sugar lactone lactonase YvrE